MSFSSLTMKETTTNVSHTITIQSSSRSTTTTRISKTVPSQCKICGASALYSYFGAVSCESCKMFFKRNAEKKQSLLKCDFDGHCEINMNNRHTCTSCRIDKCFASGMRSDMIRACMPKKKKKIIREKKPINPSLTTTTSTDLLKYNRTDQLQQVPTLNLIQPNSSELNFDQWNLLSNLVHCYDEHSGYLLTERFVREQNILPIKLRYKCGSVCELISLLAHQVQQLFKKNQNFLSLCSDDRSTLLRNIMPYVTCLSATIALRQPNLYENPAFFKAAETVLGINPMNAAKRAYDQLDSDLSFIKLILSILVFSTIKPPVITPITSINLIDIKLIFRIQEKYIELIWRYLLYKYNHEQAVICLSNVVRCIFAVIEAVRESQDIKQHKDVINAIIEETEKKLIINSE